MKNTNYSKFNRPSFALIFVLLFVTLLLITAASIWLTGLAEIRLQRRTEYSTGAYQLAKAGIDDGWVWYENAIGSNYPLPSKTYPANATVTPSKVYRTFADSSVGTTGVINSYSTPTITQTAQGVYDYWVYAPASGNKYIYSIGYYKGNKVTLKGMVTHPANEEECSEGGSVTDCVTRGGTRVLNHDGDTLTITQE